MAGINKKIVEKYLAIEHFRQPFRYIPGTEIWEIVEPWKPTYWKTLPKAYGVTYQYQEGHRPVSPTIPYRKSMDSDFDESEDQIWDWFGKTIDNWYTRPKFD